MILYATITSERATKTQGGNKFIQANFTAEKKHIISVTLQVNGENCEMWVTHPNEDPKQVKVWKLKGEKQKGECLHSFRDGTDFRTHCRLCGAPRK